MDRKLGRLLLIGWLALIFSAFAAAAAELKVGDKVGNLQFSDPLTPKDQQYLGLTGPGKFSLMDVQGQYLLIEVFSHHLSPLPDPGPWHEPALSAGVPKPQVDWQSEDHRFGVL
jgi:hypothetical protein